MNVAEKLAHGIVDSLRKAWEFLNKDVPEWLVELCTKIGEILFGFLSSVGQAYINQLIDKIVATKNDYPNSTGEEKFNIVWDFAKTLLPNYKENEIDNIIQNLYSMLKKEGRV